MSGIDIKVGTKVYLVGIYHSNKDKEDVITKVGRKYFYTGESWGQLKFITATMKHYNGEYIPEYVVYTSKEEYELYLETKEVYQKLRSNHFSSSRNLSKLTIPQMNKINSIIEDNINE